MKVINTMKFTIPAMSRNEALARSCIAAFAAGADPTVEELSDIRSAVCEAVTNSIVHGYRDKQGMVYISVKIFEGGKAVVRVRDKGCGIADVRQAMEPLFTTGGEERAGLGFAVMQSFCDSVRVTSAVGRGTSVTLTKHFEPKE